MKESKKVILGIVGVLIAFILVFIYWTNFRTVTVTFTLKIGAGIETQEVKVGGIVVEPETPTADGYVFKGWYLDGKEYDFSTPVKGNINLEAIWEKVD